jgi:hypothetical protein
MRYFNRLKVSISVLLAVIFEFENLLQSGVVSFLRRTPFYGHTIRLRVSPSAMLKKWVTLKV